VNATALEDDTLLNDTTVMDEDSADKIQRDFLANDDAPDDSDGSEFNWDNEEELLWDLMEEGYV